MLEFKLNLLFEIYKDNPLGCREEFRGKIKRKYGKFEYIEELILMIENYQFKTYGMTLYRGDFVKGKSKEEMARLKVNARNRRRSRLRR